MLIEVVQRRHGRFRIKVRIDFLCDYELARERRWELQHLLSSCFPEFLADRTYYKQVPHGRLLATRDDRLVGQVGIDYRIVRSGGAVLVDGWRSRKVRRRR